MKIQKTSSPRIAFQAGAVAAALWLAGNLTAFGTPSTVGTLTPAPPTVGIVDSPVNVGNANFITLTAMSNAVSTAFANGTGGVIDWEGANGWVANGQNATSQTVSYGASQSSLLTITRNDGAGNAFGPTTGAGSPTTSGTNYLGFTGSGSPVTLTFSTPLLDWGMVQLDRFSSRTVTFTFTLADNSTVAYAAQTQDPTSSNTGADNWYGFQASSSNPLVGVSFTANGFTRFDDMAFVAAPEPATFALAGIGGAALLMAIRRQRK